MTATQPGPVEAIATGLLEVDEWGGVVNRLTQFDGAVMFPGQRLQVREDDPRTVELVRDDRLTIVDRLPTPQWWEAVGRILMTEEGHATVRATAPQDGALRIVQGTGFDPGAAAFRLHTAFNETSPHCSAFVRQVNDRNNPYACPTQYELQRDINIVRALLLDADVIHCHVDALLTRNVGFPARPRNGQVIIRHYHGTQFDADNLPVPDEQQAPRQNAKQDDLDGYLLIGARLQLCALRPGRIHWLPIPIPCTRYAAMSNGSVRGSVFRIAHSPTRRRLKGTDVFLAVVQRLQARDVPVEAVLIENVTHREALRIRATTDATFDSFTLGLQGSGLEAAAMGQPAIAGDAHVRDLYQEQIGYCPYTFAPDEAALEKQIERLIMDRPFYEAEARKIGDYCRRHHDYAAVAARYDAILREAA